MGTPAKIDFADLLLEAARDSGFPLAGALDLDSADIQGPVQRYDDWLARGFAGEMNYLVRGRERRANPRLVYPEAQSILCVALPYSAAPCGSAGEGDGVRYARYLRGDDYHDRMPSMLEDALQKVKSHSSLGEPASSLAWKICVDTSAVLERTWAALAGLGWIGKNGMLIHPQHGSYLLLGFALLNQKVERGPRLLANYCGSCERCLQSCPTAAILPGPAVDSNRCISYLTLEKRGPLALSDDLASRIGTWVAGCDLCQEVCPFNQKVSKAPVAAADGAVSLWEFDRLEKEGEEEYRARVRESALNRVKPADFKRNLAIARANSRRRSGTSPPD